jgi:hypothetical protein
MVDFSIAASRPQAALDFPLFHEWTSPGGTPWTRFYRIDSGYLLRFPGLADFQVSADGLVVTCFPAPDASEATFQHLYLNQVRSLVLGNLGKLVFHASAVEVEDGAVAFVADSGRGKSTLAASFAISGWRFLTDEGLVLEEREEEYQVMPSHPSIRLWDDSQDALIPPGAKMAPALDYTSKSRFLAGHRLVFCEQPRPLRRVYFLGEGGAPSPRFERMSAAEALIALVKASFLLDVEEKPRLASHFDQVARLANQPVHYRLDFPRRFEQLASVRQAIVEHAKDRAR